ncbi:MAG: nitroreductase [Desulfuromonas sp.]|nr:MAG: nitroreductase [Desulfuromonas sp.]
MAIKHSLYNEEGIVSVAADHCCRCGLCVETCPAEVLILDGETVRQISDGFGCIACGHCMLVCPEGCINVSGRGISPDDLIPLPPPNERADAAKLQALMQSRRSIRHFDNRPVEPELLDQVIAMAESAPMGIPPWDVGVVKVAGFDEVNDLAGEVITGYRKMMKVVRPGLLRLLRPFIGKVSYDQFHDFILPLAQKYSAAWHEGRDTLFWGAPALLLFHQSPYADKVDSAIACTYAMLAAEALGLGSCIIGGAPPILQRNRPLCTKLGIPEGNSPGFALIIGYPAVKFQRAVRRHFSHGGD